MRVFVLNMRGEPLMPCRPSVARKYLRDGKAKVVRRTPFTIQLKIATGEAKQDITLGIDAGSKTVGISATTEKEELYCAEAVLRNDIVELLADRASLRKVRRSRKTRYRQARFDNRKRSKPEGWLAPSVRHKIDSHLKLVKDIHKILPITKIIVETASFDIQKIKNPDIEGQEYQQGEQLGFYNVRQYVMHRDNHKCQHCKGKSKEEVLHVHHIETRRTGGDSPSNLITLCKKCHNLHHDNKIKLDVKRKKSYRDSAFMGIMRNYFFEELRKQYRNVRNTYGYITKWVRKQHDIEKSHINDAFVIAGNMKAKRLEIQYRQKFIRRNNRMLHKLKISKGGTRKNNKSEYEVFGFRLFDKVLLDNQECFVWARRKTGSFRLRLLDYTEISAGKTYKKIKLIERAQNPLIERVIL